MRLNLASAVIIVSLLGVNSQAAIIWNEANNGPLSTNNLAPTDLQILALGTSTVSGNVTNSTGNVDVFQFSVPAGTRLDTIILSQYSSGDPLAFIAMDSGPTFPFNRQQLRVGVDETQFIGGTTFGSGNAPLGTDLLSSSFIGGRFIGRQPTPEQTTAVPYNSLPSGQYTVYIQQQGGLTEYTLDFGVVAVPEPTAASLLTAILLVATRRRNRAVA